MARKPSMAAQDAAYDQGYRARSHTDAFVSPYDSDTQWLLFMAYEQGWNDATYWLRERDEARALRQRLPLVTERELIEAHKEGVRAARDGASLTAFEWGLTVAPFKHDEQRSVCRAGYLGETRRIEARAARQTNTLNRIESL